MGGHGARQAVALGEVAAERLQPLDMGGCLGALGDDQAVEGPAQGDDALDDAQVRLVVEHAQHEAAVYLQRIDRKLAHVGHRRIAGTEIIQREQHAQRPAFVEPFANPGEVRDA